MTSVVNPLGGCEDEAAGVVVVQVLGVDRVGDDLDLARGVKRGGRAERAEHSRAVVEELCDVRNDHHVQDGGDSRHLC